MTETDVDAESESESDSESDHPPADGFNVGDVVHDRDSEDDEPTSAYVSMIPDATAEEWPAYEDTTVAEDNPDYPADAQVVEVVFGNTVNFELPDWDRISPLSPSDVEDAGGRSYSFPAPRLRREHVSPDTSGPNTPESSETDAESPADESEPESESAESGPEGESKTPPDEDSSEQPPNESTSAPSAALVALERHLESAGMETDIAADGQSVRVRKADESYRVSLDSGVEGDGPHRTQLEEAVEKLRAATQATTE